MENILTGNSIFQLTGTHEALFIKIWSQDAGFFCLCVRDSEDCHDLIKIYLLAAMQGFHKTGVGMWDHNPCY